jgi:hypothetical protein
MSNERHRPISYRPVAPVRRDDTVIPGESGKSRNPVALGRPSARQLDAGENTNAIVTATRARRPLRGEGESRQGPTGTDTLTSAFAESTRARRPAAVTYPGQDGGRLLAVGGKRPVRVA